MTSKHRRIGSSGKRRPGSAASFESAGSSVLGKPLRQGSRQELQRRGYSNARSSFDERDLSPALAEKPSAKVVAKGGKVMFSVEETAEHLHGRRRAVSRTSPMLNSRASVGRCVYATFIPQTLPL